MSFVKIYGTILDSSVWGEPAPIVKVWMTLLVMADKNGIVRASLPGLARRAVVDLADAEAAIAKFLAPDPYSQDKHRSPDSDGRRIEVVPEGWRLINHAHYRDMRTDKQVSDAERIREKRERGEYDSRGPVRDDATRSNVAPDADVDAEAATDSETKDSSTTARDVENKIGDIIARLKIPNPSEQVVAWKSVLAGMMEGLGTSGMKAVTIDVLTEASEELAAAGGTVSVHRFKTFVTKVIERQSREKERGTRAAAKSGADVRAMEIVDIVRNRRAPGYLSQFTDAEIRAIDTVTKERIINADAKQLGFVALDIAKVLKGSA